jgi:hypothetical protein
VSFELCNGQMGINASSSLSKEKSKAQMESDDGLSSLGTVRSSSEILSNGRRKQYAELGHSEVNTSLLLLTLNIPKTRYQP